MLKCRSRDELCTALEKRLWCSEQLRKEPKQFVARQDGLRCPFVPFMLINAHQSMLITSYNHKFKNSWPVTTSATQRAWRIVVFVFFGVWTIPSSVLPAGLPSAMERETENGCPSHPKSARLGMMLKPLEPGKRIDNWFKIQTLALAGSMLWLRLASRHVLALGPLNLINFDHRMWLWHAVTERISVLLSRSDACQEPSWTRPHSWRCHDIHRLLSQSWTVHSRNWYRNRYRIIPDGKSMTLQVSELSCLNIDDIWWLSIMKSGTTLRSHPTPDSKTPVAYEIRNPNHPVQIHVVSPKWVKPATKTEHTNSKLTPNTWEHMETTPTLNV